MLWNLEIDENRLATKKTKTHRYLLFVKSCNCHVTQYYVSKNDQKSSQGGESSNIKYLKSKNKLKIL
jgi:hypothetical protein